MKLIITVLLLAVGAFAQNNQYIDFDPTGAVEVNTTYKDGIECNCDYIVTTYTEYEADSVSGDTTFTNDTMREFPFKKGKINGDVRNYHESGELASSTKYTNGKANGISKGYYVSGGLSWETHFTNGKENGILKIYNDSSILDAELYMVNDKQNGIQKLYYESGSLKCEVPFTNDKANGIQKEYFENGKLAGTATYKNDKLIGYKKCTDGRFGNETLDCLK